MILFVFFGSLFISIVDFVLPLIWEKYRFYRNLIRFILGLLTVGILLKPFIKKKMQYRITYEIIYDHEALRN